MMAQLTDNARRVLEARYLQRDEAGRLVESPEQMFCRVGEAVAQAERAYGDEAAVRRWGERFTLALSRLDFLPNSPTLMNVGTANGQPSACFVLPVPDSLGGIFDSLKLMALIQQTGGGTGFAFSRLRPHGDPIRTSGGTSSGPISFMRIFDCATEQIREGGRRRGANMGVLRVDHPDILEFVQAKLDGASLRNFNLSVGITDAFMEARAAGAAFALRHPASGATVRELDAAELWQRIVDSAWRTGDPGLLFLDALNRANPTPTLGAYEATNPCGEVPLLPYEACNLGSINLGRMLREEADGPAVDWNKLRETTRLAVRFLDDVIEIGRWPSRRIAATVHGNRKVGLGVMGFAEALIALGIPYDSPEAVDLTEELMRCMASEAQNVSEQLAAERGVFPNWPRSIFAPDGSRRRNATLLSIAPTGTLSLIAGTSASIEPLFALAYRREHVLGEQTLVELNPLLLRYADRHGLDRPALERHLRQHGTLDGIAVPEPARRLFRTALEFKPDDHLRIQAAFQWHVDNAVSKTINLPEDADPGVVGEAYEQAWRLGLKGITVYRYGSKAQQVLRVGLGEPIAERHEHHARCDPEACRL